MDRRTATESLEALSARARDEWRRDARFRALADHVVAHELQKRDFDYGNVTRRQLHELAQDIATTMLQAIYEDDAELVAQKLMAERYRKLAEDSLACTLKPPVHVGHVGIDWAAPDPSTPRA